MSIIKGVWERKLTVLTRVAFYSSEYAEDLASLYDYLKEHEICCEICHYHKGNFPEHFSGDPYHIYGLDFFQNITSFFVLYVHRFDFKRAVVLKNLFDISK